MWFVLFVGVLWTQACGNVQTSRNETCRYSEARLHETRGDLRRPAGTSQQHRRLRPCQSRRATGRMPDAPLTKIAITNLCAKDRPRCPYVVAVGISCWARSDSIPHTCAASDPTLSDSLTSQFHLSNTYYKGRTTRWRLSRFVSANCPVLFKGFETLGRRCSLFSLS